MSIHIHDLTSLDACRALVALQVEVWGADSETVPASVLFVSAKRGGILLGASDDSKPDTLLGFVWSMPGWKHGQPTHWSHMLGVLPAGRRRGIGEALKRAQRERALAQGAGLIEWTFDPLQAANAHLNLSRLGAVVSTYLVDAYGEMTGPLHRGTATDRLVAEWWIPEAPGEARASWGAGAMPDVPQAIVLDASDAWTACVAVDTRIDAPAILVPVPPHFGDMQRRATDLAQAWRAATRDVFTTYFGRGYRAVDFFLDRQRGGGAYLLVREIARGIGNRQSVIGNL